MNRGLRWLKGTPNRSFKACAKLPSFTTKHRRLFYLEDNLLRLHVVKDLVSFDSVLQRHDLVGHEAVDQ